MIIRNFPPARVLQVLLVSALAAGCATQGAPAGSGWLERILASPVPASTQPALKQPVLKQPVWAQSVSDIKADPDVRFGTLANGMRYAIARNSTPTNQASIRLRLDVGSLHESERELGVAHFLEHMAFNGSTRFAEGELVKQLERLGLAFGADTNASTSLDETIYKLDLPNTEAVTVDTALTAFREVASELTIAQDAVDRERGIVLSEERSRDSPSFRAYKARLAFNMSGQLAPQRMPIGTVEILRSVNAETLRSFYRRWYRPERATLILVGDFDPAAIEAQVRTMFSDWQASGPAVTEPDPGQPRKRSESAEVLVEPGSQSSVELSWAGAPDLSPDSQAKRIRGWRERLVLAVLNRRMEQLARSGSAPFIAAGAFSGTQFRSARITTLISTFPPQGRVAALTALEQEQRRLVQHGVRADELAREITELRAQMANDVASAGTRRTPTLANALASSLTDNDVITSPAQDLELFELAVRDFNPADARAVIRGLFDGSGPLVFASGPADPTGDEVAILSALKSSRQLAVAAAAAPSVTQWPYETFGKAGTVASRQDWLDLDASLIQFRNGVRLIVKPTRFKDDQVLIRVRMGSGLSGMSANAPSSGWAASAFIEGGLAKVSAEDMERLLADKLYGARLSIEDDAVVLGGGTRPDDLETQLQVLTAFVSDPGWRPAAFERMRSYSQTLADQYEATNDGIIERDLAALIRSGDARWAFPGRDALRTSRLESLQAQVEPALQNGPVEILIIGDTTTDKAVDAVARTLGSLPEFTAQTPARVSPKFPKPSEEALVLRHKGRADQASALLAWPTPDFHANPRDARALSLLAEVLELRLIEEVREAQAITYSPGVSASASTVFPGYGYLFAVIEAPPATLDGFFRDVKRFAQDLRTTPVSADELERARKPRLEGLARSRQTNEYWINQLAGASFSEQPLTALRTVERDYAGLTAADLKAVAVKYLQPDVIWMLKVLPEK